VFAVALVHLAAVGFYVDGGHVIRNFLLIFVRSVVD